MASKKDPIKQLEKAYKVVCAFPEGVEVLQHICALTGFGAPLTCVNSNQEVNVQASLYNLRGYDLWIDIRKFLDAERREQIENRSTVKCQEVKPEAELEAE